MDKPVVAAWPRVVVAARPSAVETEIMGPAATLDGDVAGAFSCVLSSTRAERAVFFFRAYRGALSCLERTFRKSSSVPFATRST